jgi:hypothetical protein
MANIRKGMYMRSKEICLLFVSIALLTSGCEKELTPAERLKNLEASVGMSASITASFWVSAIRACRIVGLSDIEACSKQKGMLLDEQTARVQAESALTQRDEYFKSCQASFSQDYCLQLVKRGVLIEWRKPERSKENQY